MEWNLKKMRSHSGHVNEVALNICIINMKERDKNWKLFLLQTTNA